MSKFREEVERVLNNCCISAARVEDGLVVRISVEDSKEEKVVLSRLLEESKPGIFTQSF